MHHRTLRPHGQARADRTQRANELGDEGAHAQQVGHVVAVEVGHDQCHATTSSGRRPVLHLQWEWVGGRICLSVSRRVIWIRVDVSLVNPNLSIDNIH